MDFKCKEGCGECCGIILIPKKLAIKTEHLAQVKPNEVIAVGDDLMIITEDLKCVYLNRETKKCMIYDDRPNICRVYGLIPMCRCPYIKMDGSVRNRLEREFIKVEIANAVDDAIEKAREIETKHLNTH